MIDNLLTAALISILATAIFALGYSLGAHMPKRCEVCGTEIKS